MTGEGKMVIIFLGSKSDHIWGKEIVKYLSEFDISYKLHIASAHKTPEYLLNLIKKYEGSNKQIVYICVAGRSNALGGFVDAQTKNPVINCPPYSEKYGGLDILSSLRMPSGVAPLTVLEPEQAALAAAKILGFKE
ncbi:AIR carboxylase family protein, partial [Candidatus Gottesmanbacteria bacterium]|nr:AIR carboxylase family protein [Candidatus Gottesmanbacteria bacterium]